MSTLLSRQQVNDFQIQLNARFFELRHEFEREGALSYGACKAAVDLEFEGCVNLLFDLNYANITELSRPLVKYKRYS